MVEDDTQDATEELSEAGLFPLPNAILLPGCLLPLHVFEPRYRALVADTLESKRLIAIATPRSSAADPGNAILFPVCGVGTMIRHHPNRA